MKILVVGLLVGLLVGTVATWGLNILFIGWYLSERDKAITELMAGNEILKGELRVKNFVRSIDNTILFDKNKKKFTS